MNSEMVFGYMVVGNVLYRVSYTTGTTWICHGEDWYLIKEPKI